MTTARQPTGALVSRMHGWATHTISRRLLGAFLLVFLATYLATAVVVLSATRTSITKAELGTLEQLAHLELNNLNNRFDQLATNLHAWSKLDVMNDLASGDVDKRVARALENLKGDYSLRGDLYAFDSSGHLVASSDRQQGAAALPDVWKAHGQLGFIDKHVNPLGQGEVVVLSTPVTSAFSAGYSLGTLVLVYPWAAVQATLSGQTILLRQAENPVLLASLLQTADTAHLLSALTRPDADGWIEIDGTRYLANGAKNDDGLAAGWSIVTLKATASLDHTLDIVALKLAGLCALLSIPLTMAIRWLAQRLTAPLRELTQVVSAITATGDLSRRVTVQTDDEIGTLARAFNDMTARLDSASGERERLVRELESSAEELEAKVKERTRELTVTNAELTDTLEELKAAQSQLIHQEKMASLGQLVAGVAHELNNPIGFIYANFPHLEEYAHTLIALIDDMRGMRLSAEDQRRLEARLKEADLDFLRQDLLKIIRSGQSGATRVKDIISSLRSFSRLDEALEKPARLEDGLDDTLALLQHQFKNRIDVVRDYRLNQSVLCRPGQINQVIMNILYNAAQAIEGRGTITVSTRREGESAVVAIADTGSGIPPDIRKRIFDPFFTTKKVGDGTGLGLSISYGIIEKHGGRIDVESEVGHGTTFTLYIPLTPTATALATDDSTTD
ncbi:MAG: ATP-binding protein [Rhodocyclaceae bacterium]|nr:ATP-binding protein [Rhodocyclaceae bacterium]